MLTHIATRRAIWVVAAIHVLMAVAEIVLWTPLELWRRFGFAEDPGRPVAAIAMNVGIYILFLAAGLVWALQRRADGIAVARFFLVFVVIAGVFGGATLNSIPIGVGQALPAAIALALLWTNRSRQA